VNKSAADYKRALVKLTSSVNIFIDALDREMTKPSTLERGRRIAVLSNYLNLNNDMALHFGLGYSFKKLERLKRKQLPPAVAGRE
jgi:hypothetical protein